MSERLELPLGWSLRMVYRSADSVRGELQFADRTCADLVVPLEPEHIAEAVLRLRPGVGFELGGWPPSPDFVSIRPSKNWAGASSHEAPTIDASILTILHEALTKYLDRRIRISALGPDSDKALVVLVGPNDTAPFRSSR